MRKEEAPPAGPAPYPYGGGPMVDESIIKFINSPDDFVPATVRRESWGWAMRLMGLGKFTPNQAMATRYRFRQYLVNLRLSYPSWSIDADFLREHDNLSNLVSIQTYRATVPRNERELIATEHHEYYTGPIQTERKKRWGIF